MHLPLLLSVSLSGFRTAQRGACQADSLFLAERPIPTGLVNLIGKNHFGVTAEFPVIILDHRSQVTDMVSLEDIQRILCEQKNPESMVQKLVDSAMEAGGRDNITAVCVQADGTTSRVKKLDGMLMRFFA